MAWRVRIAVKIRTGSAEIWNVGPTIQLQGSTLELRDGLLVYPDRRVQEFRIYAWDTALVNESQQGWESQVRAVVPPGYANGSLPALQSETTNEAYVLLPETINLSSAPFGLETLAEVVRLEQPETMPGALFYSEPFRPFSLSADQFLSVSLQPGDELLRITSTTREMSTGQFGQYPIVLFGKTSIWAVALTDEGLPGQVVPVSVLHGLLAEHGVAGIDGAVAFVARDGIWLLSQGLEELPISRALHAFGLQTSFVLDPEATLSSVIIDEQPALVYGRANSPAHIYWLTLGGWSTCDRRARLLIEYDGRLLFLGTTDTNNRTMLRRWNADPSAGDQDYVPSWQLKTAPIGGDRPEGWKRIWYLSLRQRLHSGSVDVACKVDNTTLASTTIGSATDTAGLYVPAVQQFVVEAGSFALYRLDGPPLSAADTEIYGIDIIYENRYEHRPLVSKPS